MHTKRWISPTTLALALCAGCLDRRAPLPPDDPLPRALAMALNLELRGGVAAGERVVEIRARYRRENGELPTLPVQPARVTLQDGETIQQSVVVNIGPCNGDTERVPNEDGSLGCRFAMELTLLNGAGEVLGNAEEMIGPVGDGEPSAPTFIFTAPTLTLSQPGVSFTAQSQQQLPPPQPVTVGVDIDGASVGTLAAAITFNSGQNWLRATVDQGARAVVVQPTTTALTTGTYTAVVSVTSSVDGVKPRTLAVTYQVQPQPVLTVSAAGGDGTGTITSEPGGIDCTISDGAASGTCTATFDPGTSVSLTATPSANHRFGGWGGACSGSSSCSVTVTQPTTVTARFNAPLPVLTVTGNGGDGSGTVRSSVGGILCTITSGDADGTCDATFNPGAAVVLTATPAGKDRFAGWGGACSGTGTCSVTLNQPVNVTARFLAPLPVLQLSPTSLAFSGIARSTTQPARQSVTASNGGGGSLGAITIAGISYGSSASGWLDPTVSGSVISVGANPANVVAGTHTATVTVRSANGGTATFTATFTVTNPPPRLGITPNVLSFAATAGSSPPGKTARASNIGFGTFADLGTITVGSTTTSWLRVSFDGDIIVVSPIVSNFVVGTHAGTVVINSSRGGSATIAVTVTVSGVIVR